MDRTESRDVASPPPDLVRAGLDTLDFGFAIFDAGFALVACNVAFRTLRGYPAALCVAGTPLVEFYRYNAARGDYGAGDVDVHAQNRLDRVRARQPHALEYTAASGQQLSVRYAPIEGGLVLTYADITARKEAEALAAQRDEELTVALANMPGALAYTDGKLDIVLCNDRFAEMYAVPRSLLARGRPYPAFLRHLAERGYYGEGDVDALVARRVDSLRNPSGVTFEDRTPDGHTYEVYRRRAGEGGTVTVITDISGLKAAEARLARKEAELGIALDNMPGALAYTDAHLDIVVCNRRFADMYPVPKALLQPGEPYPAFLRHLAEHGYYGEGDVDALVAARVESLRHPSGLAFEDRAPDGRVYRVARRAVESGGTITVITDISELKHAEGKLVDAVRAAEEANRRATEQNATLESLSSKLQRYLSPQLYRSLFKGEKGAEVASQRKKLTIFFSDIAGFTETTDLLESEELTSLLNQYLREMSSIAIEHGATIDKFIGDAIMLFFGDPETRGPREDAIACVRMAVAMQQRMRDLQAEWRERGQEHVFQLRIGINTGYCTVGNFGSAERVDYTVIGNEVNLASRLQTHADLGGILLAHETYALVRDVVMCEETGTITVKGFSKPVRTHRVVGLYGDDATRGRVIRQEQDGLLLVVDRGKLSDEGRVEAVRALQDAVRRLQEP
ncbi:MAG: PAS-domain containing protein [Betaproteobacteria bacterium]|nr:PAS-domain containing protein [Betaproteobacteria bacterium]